MALPLLSLVAAASGFAGIVVAGSGLFVRSWIIEWDARLSGFPQADPGIPTVFWSILAIGSVLLLADLAGLLWLRGRDRRREALRRRAEALIEGQPSTALPRAA